LERKTGEVRLVRAGMPWIDPARMQPTRVMRVKSRDGYPLETYLTLPAGATTAHPPPVVVLPHGGPHTRDAWGFNGEVQFLASRGYAVLQVNYRGSTGYAWMFPAADLWDFRKMHNDVTDAAQALAASGLVDGGRMAIMGSSFGGYLALCGAAFEPGRYRCAITIAGVFDWARVIEDQRSVQYENPAYGAFVRALGDPRANPAAFAAISPLLHLDQVGIPIFVAHGRDDTVADYRESRDLVTGLEKLRIPHEALIVAGEGHGMSYTRNQVELHDRIAAFLARHLGPAK
jgi:dipeptidyl aminopeptidase/acylaminoacyl peptidase